eukprot:9688147-Ditylum_brightwellii.AAC.1
MSGCNSAASKCWTMTVQKEDKPIWSDKQGHNTIRITPCYLENGNSPQFQQKPGKSGKAFKIDATSPVNPRI